MEYYAQYYTCGGILCFSNYYLRSIEWMSIKFGIQGLENPIIIADMHWLIDWLILSEFEITIPTWWSDTLVDMSITNFRTRSTGTNSVQTVSDHSVQLTISTILSRFY